jgi:hypothetical protein
MKANTFIRKTIVDQDMENAIGIQRMVKEHFEAGVALPQDIEDKIERRCKKYGNMFDRMHLLTGISRDIALASEFCKKANRQGKAEVAQRAYLNKRNINVEKLPVAGPESIRLSDGEIFRGKPAGKVRSVCTTKSFDAELTRGKNKTDFIMFKWTDGEGGAQDNQAGDIIQFIDQAKKYVKKHDDNVRFVAILDGKYYQKRWNLLKDYVSDRVMIENCDSYMEQKKNKKKRK